VTDIGDELVLPRDIFKSSGERSRSHHRRHATLQLDGLKPSSFAPADMRPAGYWGIHDRLGRFCGCDPGSGD